ncbi:MAG TPA: SDR family NAD(P)-dependent oxidoreductase [Tepidisphaeraceae bacterium]|nr:SDR family NAD(P)-dependent oxidoreductase [Tepidisphaeraceae bacterium]
MEIKGKIAMVTGAGSGIGQSVALELAKCQVSGLALVDRAATVHDVVAKVNDLAGKMIAFPFVGDVTQAPFRKQVYDEIERRLGVARICVPAAGITRDSLAVRIDKVTGDVILYAEESFRQVMEVNLVASTYWVLEMIGRIAADRFRQNVGRWDPKKEKLQGTAIFIGSVSSQGNKGQVAYAATKRGLEGVAATLMKEAMYYGVKCAVIHPGYTDTPMVRTLGDEFIEKSILPFTQLKRLIRPEEIAGAICFMIGNSAISGELWCDAGWHPTA